MKKQINITKQSKSLKLNKEDGVKIWKSFKIAVGGFLLTYATDLIPIIEWGEYKPFIVAISGFLINFGWKLLKGKK